MNAVLRSIVNVEKAAYTSNHDEAEVKEEKFGNIVFKGKVVDKNSINFQRHENSYFCC